MQTLCAILVGLMMAASVYLILDRNLIRFIFGLVLAGNAVNLLIFTVGGLSSRRPPLIPVNTAGVQESFANALPQALILTAIVIGFALLSFIFVLFLRAYRDLGTIDTERIRIAEAETDPQRDRSRPPNGGPV
jgi:multicomponent Na+:H+ antiporter subunit C